MTTSDHQRPILQLQGLTKAYGSFVALDGIDLTVSRGEVFGFLGPNGAGKTTTLRLITGLARPTAGSARVCGFDVQRQPGEAKRRMGFISDRPFLYEKLTAMEFLRFVGGIWGMTRQAIADQAARWLEVFDLQGWAGEPIESFSHGMRQRILFCSALIHEPELLIMDEPMVGLDPRGARTLKQVVRDLSAEGTTVILSTHTLEVVDQICDSVAIIDRGKIVTSGPLEQVRREHHAEGDRLEELFFRLTAEGGDE